MVTTVHEYSALTVAIEHLVMQHSGADKILAYTEDDMKLLPFGGIECITVLDGKTVAIDQNGMHYRLNLRLYEQQKLLPASFIRINKSTLANESRLERFSTSFSGAVDAVFRCGYREYVSRRCFVSIKRRYESL